MSSLNKVILIGNLGQSPDIRTMQSGDKVANLSIATSERWKDKSTGEHKEKTEWHRVVVFGKLVDIVESYLTKGSKVYLEGKLETRSWEQDGVKKYTTEIVMRGFDSKIIMLGGNDATISEHSKAKADGYQTDFDDEIPFMRLLDEQF